MKRPQGEKTTAKEKRGSVESFHPVPVLSTDEQYRIDRLVRITARLIRHKHIDILGNLLDRLLPSDISYLMEFLDQEERTIILSILPEKMTAEIIPEISRDVRNEILDQHDPGWIAQMVDNMESDDAADILSELPKDRSSFVLRRIDQEDAAKIRNLMKYDETSAGGIMATELLAVSADASVAEVIAEFKKLAEQEEIEDIHFIYVIDDRGVLLGAIPLRKLILNRSRTKARQIMDKDIITVNVDTDQEEVAAVFKRHNLLSVPVIDDDHILLGRITIDDVVDVIDEENSEDIYRMAGVGIDSTINASVYENIRRRLPWLCVNMLTAAVSASVVGMFESVIEQMAILAAFMPIVAGLGGNAGAQVIAIVVRALALGELTDSNTIRVLLREISTGILNGLIIGTMIGISSSLITGKTAFGLVIGAAMMMNVIAATMAGLLVPVLLRKLHADPAVSSNIFVTPMTDTLGFFLFLGLAKIFIAYF